MRLFFYIKTAIMVFVFCGAFGLSMAQAQNNQLNFPDVPSNLNFPSVPLGDVSFPPSAPNISNIAGLTPSAASALNSTPNFGQLNPTQLAQNVLSIPAISNSFNQTLQNAGVGATIEQITQVTQAALNPQSILQSPQALGELMGGVLQNVSPDFVQAINGQLGQAGQLIAGGANDLIGGALGTLNGQEITANLPAQLSSLFEEQLTEQLGSLLGGALTSQLREQFTQALSGVIGEQLTTQLGGAIGQALGGAIGQTLGSALGGGLSSALGGAFSSPDAQAQAQQQAQQPNQQQDAKDKDCKGCDSCANCPVKINENQRVIRLHDTSEFEQHRSWFVTTWWIDLVAPALGAMTSQFTANMVAQVQAIGGFFDAKHQLETQRLFNTLTAKAHKDYHPSEQLCTIGTNVRSLAASEKKSNLAQSAIANYMMQRQLSSGDTASKEGRDSDRRTRLKSVLETYCRPTDNGNSFDKLCTASNTERMSKDVDFTSTLDSKLTLDLDFSGTEAANFTDDERDLLALGSNLFAHNVLDVQPAINFGRSPTEITQLAYYYLDYRAMAAKRSVAQNSFAAIAAEKAEGDQNSAPFLRAILAETGVNPQDIEQRLGKNPSYFAQMEVMTKDLYQNPTFYSNLYDKPVNVERKAVALQAIELMQDRDIYNSLLRSESVLATLVETMLIEEHGRVSATLDNVRVGQ